MPHTLSQRWENCHHCGVHTSHTAHTPLFAARSHMKVLLTPYGLRCRHGIARNLFVPRATVTPHTHHELPFFTLSQSTVHTLHQPTRRPRAPATPHSRRVTPRTSASAINTHTVNTHFTAPCRPCIPSPLFTHIHVHTLHVHTLRHRWVLPKLVMVRP